MGDEQIDDFAVDLGDCCQEHADQFRADFDRYSTTPDGTSKSPMTRNGEA